MPVAIPVTYKNELWNMRDLAWTTGVHYNTIVKWRAQGVLPEKLDACLQLRELREKAAARRLRVNTVAVRRSRGWSLVEAYTTPLWGDRNQKEGVGA